MHDVAEFQRSTLAGPLERLPAEDPMILLPLMLIWLRDPMHFSPPARWAVVAWAICIAVSSAAAEERSPLRGWESHEVGGSLEIASLTSVPLAIAAQCPETAAQRLGVGRSNGSFAEESQKNPPHRGGDCAAIPAAKGTPEAATLALWPAVPLAVALQLSHPPERLSCPLRGR